MTSLPVIPECIGCAACCMSVGHPPFSGYDDSRQGQPCSALDLKTNRCTIYASRPMICRDFERGSVECRMEREAAQ